MLHYPKTTDELMRYAESTGHGEIHIKIDHETGLHAITAIHNTNLGPALGGCRFLSYHDMNEAIYDAMRLAHGMTYKNAISNLPLGGGKTVIIRPAVIKNREALFEAFGRFVNDLGGRYITAVDSGTSVEDMDFIHRKTNFVTSISSEDASHGDPSFSTALGVYQSILAAVKFNLGKNDVDGLHIAIQGTGHVGYRLANYLFQAGAKLTVCDISNESAQRCATEFNATVVNATEIFDVACDVFSPCALGAILNQETIPRLKTKIIAGSANNQLEQDDYSKQIAKHGILYIPDYVANAGGVIEVFGTYSKIAPEIIKKDIEKIYHTVMMICEEAQAQHLDTATIADKIAAKRIYG